MWTVTLRSCVKPCIEGVFTPRALACLLLTCSVVAAGPWHWPTPHPAFDAGLDWQSWVQPTASGRPESAQFGCVRNEGLRFHEGIDVTPFLPRSEAGEATDPIYAVAPAQVVYINRKPQDSAYGRYVVVRHTGGDAGVLTLYAHLASFAPGLQRGAQVAAGEVLGVMGRSAGGYVIPQSRAHLHFEVALRLTDHFQGWYDRQAFGNANAHGVYNGMNLVGWDPQAFLRWQRAHPEAHWSAYLGQLPVGLVARVRHHAVPDFARRYPQLLSRMPGAQEAIGGWELALSAWGLPLRLTPLSPQAGEALGPPGSARIVAVDPQALERYACRKMARLDPQGQARWGSGGHRVLELLFGLR